jgi:Tol biopolymer transport system component
VYHFVYRNNPLDPKVSTQVKDTPGADTFAENTNKPLPPSKIEPVIQEKSIGAKAMNDTELDYFSIEGRSLKRLSLDTHETNTIIDNLPGTPVEAIWSNNKGQALILLDNSGLRWHLVTITSKSVLPLKENLKYPSFSNLGDKIFYQYTTESGTASVNISNPDGSDWKELVALPVKNVFTAPVPKSSDVSFWNRPNGLERSIFQTSSFSGTNTRTLLAEQFGGDYLWSPDGEKVLVSFVQEKGTAKISLATMNKNGGEFSPLIIPTLVSKCVWSPDGKSLYFALPGSLPDNIVLPNDYFSKKLLTADTFWRLDLETGKRERIVEGNDIGMELDSTQLFLSPKGDVLYFLNRRDGKTYRISL